MTVPPGDPRIRASDADREAVAARLQTAHAEGRITADELSERLDATYAARTLGDLAPLTADLPVQPAPLARPSDPAASLAPVGGRASVPASRRGSSGLRQQWAAWASTSLVLTVIWGITAAVSGSLQGFWPAWVIGIWGAGLLAQSLFGGGSDGGPDGGGSDGGGSDGGGTGGRGRG